MKFSYNSVQIGEGATGTYASGTKIDSKPSWSWSFSSVTWSCEFSKKTSTETLMRAFDTAMRNTLTGLCKISANLEITYDDGTTDEFKEEPAGAQPSGISQNPVLEHLPGDYTSSTYQRYKFTVQFEIPTAFNGIKVMQASMSHDALGFQMVNITGIMPSQYLNGTHDAIKAFDTYYTSKVENAILSTFLGKDYYKRIAGPNLTSEKGLGALGNLSEGRWKNLNFEVTYKQVAFAEASDAIVSEHLVMPTISVSQLPEAGVSIKMPSLTTESYGQAGGNDGNISPFSISKYSVVYETGVSLDSSYLGASEKAVKAKRKGYEAKFIGMAAVYHQVVRPNIIKMLQDIFGDFIALYNEQVSYTNEPRIRLTALAYPSGKKEIQMYDNYSYMVNKGFNYKLLDGKAFSMVRIEPGDSAVGTFTRTILSTSTDVPNPNLGEFWKQDSYGIISCREAGAIYVSATGGKISFKPLYETIAQYNLSYIGQASRVSVLGKSSSGEGGGNEIPTIGVG